MRWLCSVDVHGLVRNAVVFMSIFSLVEHVREAHTDVNSTCGVNECDYYVKKAYIWYNHVRRHHPSGYYALEPPEKPELSERCDKTSSPLELSLNSDHYDIAMSCNLDD